jgi:hypothetical protein
VSFQPPASAPPPPPAGRRESRRSGAGFVLPLVLIGAGVVALLLNFGLISGAQVVRAFALWPAALVVLGLVLICRAWLPRLAVPLAAVLVVALVVGAIAYSALLPNAGGATAQSDYSAPLDQAEHQRLQLGLAGSEVTVQGQDMPELYRAHVRYVAGHPPDVRMENGTVSLRDRGGFSLFGVRGANQGQVSLNQTIPWDIEIEGGASKQTLDLASLQLSSLQVSGGAEQASITLPKPKGTVAVHISGGASTITVHRPSGVAAHVDMSGGASNLTVDGDHRSVLSGDVNWSSSDYGAASDRYDFQISGGATNVSIDQR